MGDLMKLHGTHILTALRDCSRKRDLEKGKAIHCTILRAGEDLNMFIASSLIDMYGKCKRMVEARAVFEHMQHHDAVSWSLLVMGYAENGEAEEALFLFTFMKTTGYEPDGRAFVAVLRAYSALAVKGRNMHDVLRKGREIHVQAAGYDTENVYVGNALIEMYGRCRSMGEAKSVFDRMEHRNACSWNLLMIGYVENGEDHCALDAFGSMKFEECAPDRRTFLTASKACISSALKEDGQEFNGKTVKVKGLQRAKQVHQKAKACSLDSDVYVGNTLIDVYVKCGSVGNAREVFDQMQERDVISWSTLIQGYMENGEACVALEMFELMLGSSVEPNTFTYVAALRACSGFAGMDMLEKCMAIHSQAGVHGYDRDEYLACTLVDVYAKCGSIVDAQRVFDGMKQYNVVAVTALVLGYAENGAHNAALEFFTYMQDKEGCVNALTFVAVLKVCSQLAEKEQGVKVGEKVLKMKTIEKGYLIHAQASRKLVDLDEMVCNTLIDMYANCGSMVDAQGVFDQMPVNTVVSYNALMLGYVENGEAERALNLFLCVSEQANSRTFVAALKACILLAQAEEGKEIDGKTYKVAAVEKGMALHSKSFVSDIFVENTLVDMYAKCGCMVSARRVFDGMKHKDVISWNALIYGYAENGENVSLEFVSSYMKTEKSRTFLLAALKTCACVGALEQGREVHEEIKLYKDDIVLATALVDFYAKCGSMGEARAVFDSIGKKDVIAWNALLAGYARQGEVRDVLECFHRMVVSEDAVLPDGATFVSLLSACSHGGLLEEGMKYFEEMQMKYKVEQEIEHYHCIIDLLGRSNRLQEAVDMVQRMPFTATSVSWMTVLSACHKWKNVGVARVAFDKLLEMDCQRPAARVLLANIYGSVGMWEEKARVRNSMQ